MPRANFGGAQDYSGVFAGLAAADEQRIESATDRAVAQARADDAAKDERFYSQWKNGQISDEAWLRYLRTRVADTRGDPEEHEHYADLLREHQGAITDAQFETKFQLGKIGTYALIQHYQKRMRNVETNSPAWREMAGRFQELTDYLEAGGTRYGVSTSGSGGGSGSASGSGSARRAARIGARGAQSGAEPRGDGIGFSTAGKNLVDPTASLMRKIKDDDNYVDALFGDLERIDELMRQHEDNPTAKTLTDPLTGEVFKVTPDLLLEIDKQYLRTEDSIAAIRWAQGKPDDAMRALSAKGTYISGTMAAHNDKRFEPVLKSFEQNVMEQWVAASALPDPAQRLSVYKGLLKTLDALEEGALPGQAGLGVKATIGETIDVPNQVPDAPDGTERITAAIPEELKPSAEFVDRVNGWRNLLTAMTDETLDPVARNAMIDIGLQYIPSTGGMTETQLTAMLEDDPNADTEASDGTVGALVNLEQLAGIRNASNPNFDGERYTYALVGGRTTVVPADLSPTQSGGVQVVPRGLDASTLVPVAMKIGGAIRTAWATPQPVDDPSLTAYQLSESYTMQDGTTLNEGQWLPTSEIEALGAGGIQSLLESQDIVRTSVVRAVQMPGGQVWYQDPGTRLLSPVAPPLLTAGGAITIGDDGNPELTWMPHAGGYIMATYGVSPYEAQNYLNRQVEEGAIDPNQYFTRGADGNVSTDPIDVTDMFWSAAEHAQQQSLAASRLDMADLGEARRERAEALALADRQYATEQRKARAWVDNNLSTNQRKGFRAIMGVEAQDYALDKIRQIGSDMGINLGPTAGSPASETPYLRAKTADLAIQARDDAFAAVESRRARLETIRVTPRIVPKVAMDALPEVRAPLPPVSVDRPEVRPPTTTNNQTSTRRKRRRSTTPTNDYQNSTKAKNILGVM